MGNVGNIGILPVGDIRVFLLSSVRLSLALEIGFHPGISLMEPGDAAGRQPSPVGPPWSTRASLGHLGRWRRVWGPAQSRANSTRDGPDPGQALGPGYPLLPGAAHVRGEPHPRDGSGGPHRVQK